MKKKILSLLSVVAILLSASSLCVGAVMLGDVDDDHSVDIADVSLIQKHIVSISELTDEQLWAADTDGNGSVDIKDATCIQKYLSDIISTFPTDQPQTDPIITRPTQPATQQETTVPTEPTTKGYWLPEVKI